MTELEYLSTETKPAALLRFVARRMRPRKVQLMAAGFCRMQDADLTPVARRAVLALEEYATGRAVEWDYAAVRLAVWDVGDRSLADDPAYWATQAVVCALHEHVVAGARRALGWATTAHIRATDRGRKPRLAAARRRACAVIREVAGNPFRPWTHAPAFAGGGLVQPDGVTVPLNSTVYGLAEAIDVGRYFDRLPILADALEEAGVTDAELLAHCRTGVDHLPGCWAVDVVLGRS